MRTGRWHWEVYNAGVMVVVVMAIMKRVKEKKKNRGKREESRIYISWTDPSVPICEIQVAFSTHSVDPQAFYKCSEPMLLTLNPPINKHLLVFIKQPKSLEKAIAPHSRTLAWKIPWTEEPGRLQSMGSRRVGHSWVTSLSLFTFMHWRRKWQPTPVFLPGESQGQRSRVGCRLWGRIESDTTEVT